MAVAPAVVLTWSVWTAGFLLESAGATDCPWTAVELFFTSAALELCLRDLMTMMGLAELRRNRPNSSPGKWSTHTKR